MTGLVYMGGGWYDPRTFSSLGEQGGDYAFAGRMPDQGIFGAIGYRAPQQVPMGETTHGFDGGVAGSFWHGAAKGFGKTALLVGVVLAAGALALTGVGAPAAAGLIAASVGSGMLISSTLQAGAERYAEGQSGGQILVGTFGDATGLSSIYTGVTGLDMGTGEDLGLTDEERGDMFGSGVADLSMGALCLAEGTQVLTVEGNRDVVDVCLGDRLLTPQTLARPPNIGWSPEVSSDGWRVVRLCVPSPNGESPAEVELLRPVEWVEESGLAAGITLPVITESEPLGSATVLSIEPAPQISRGAGQIVTMKATRVAESAEIMTVRDEEGRSTEVTITGSHPVYVDGKGWVAVQHLKEGDQLVGDAGQLLPVERIESRAGPVRVETFEVEKDHSFLVSASDASAVWVHNARVQLRTSRKGLRRSRGDYDRMGQMTHKEFQWMRQFAKRIGKNIVMTGSLTETRIGMRNRLDPTVQHLLPEFRRSKPRSSLLHRQVGPDGKLKLPDLDFWQRSGLTDAEYFQISQRFYGWEADHTGYSKELYPTLENFSVLLDGSPGPGAIIFKADGSVTRIPGGWQRARLR